MVKALVSGTMGKAFHVESKELKGVCRWGKAEVLSKGGCEVTTALVSADGVLGTGKGS
jgi:hypothetical protein